MTIFTHIIAFALGGIVARKYPVLVELVAARVRSFRRG